MQPLTKFFNFAVVGLVLFSGKIAFSADHYDAAMLNAIGGAPTINNLDKIMSNTFNEGSYHVRLKVNDKEFGARDLFLAKDVKGNATPCLTYKDYKSIGVDFSAQGVTLNDSDFDHAECVTLAKAIEQAESHFNQAQMKVSITIPQAMLLQISDDEVPADEWDEGIPALMTEYQISGSRDIAGHSGTGSETFANLMNGINLGAWRLRNNGSVSSEEGKSAKWSSNSTYVERAIAALKGELVMGDTFTGGDTFDSVRINGVQLATDMDMYPGNMSGFAPTVRGIAKSNAKVTIRDHDNIIYQTNVPPGPFAINQLTPVSTGGNLDVTITEADGSETHYVQAYASVPTLLRAKQIKYNLALGRYSADEGTNSVSSPDVAQATLAYGLPYNMTLLSGAMSTDRYHALNLGLGLDLGLAGALSEDITFEKSRAASRQQSASQGNSLRLSYANYITPTDTTIQLTDRRYSGSFRSLADSLKMENDGNNDDDSTLSSQTSLSINQNMGAGRSFYLSANNTRYQNDNSNKMYQTGLNLQIDKYSLSLGFNMSKDRSDSDWDKQVTLSVSGTFSDFLSRPSVTYMANGNLKKDVSQSLGVTGYLLDANALNYGVKMGYDKKDGGTSGDNGSLNLGYDGRMGNATVAYNQDPDRKQVTWGMNGGMILHRHGLTFAPYAQGAQALVSAPGAAHTGLTNGKNLSTDWRGYTAVPDISPYSREQIQFDPHKVDRHVTLKSISTTVVPTKDAIVLAQFEATSGRKVMATLTTNGIALPFGSMVTLEGSPGRFFVGDQGVVYFDGAQEEGELRVSLENNQSCRAPFKLSEETAEMLVTMITLECH